MRTVLEWIRLRVKRETPRESGFVLVWFVLMLFMLLGIAALAVDLGHAYFAQQQAQNAADTAALSGVVHLSDLDAAQVAAAKNEAMIVADKNIPHDGTVTVVPSVKTDPGFSSLRPNQLSVTVTRHIDTFFARAIGFNSMTVHGTGVAEYDPPVNLGSPWSNFGTAPDCGGCFPANMSANISAQYDDKGNGDTLTMTWCNQDADNCSHGGVNNTDRDTAGELFQIDNLGGGSLQIHLFDPAWIDTHDQCENAQLYGFGVDDSYFPPDVWGKDWIPNHLDPRDNPESAVPPSDYCTGDNTAGTNFLHYNPNANPTAGADAGNSVYQDPAIATNTAYSIYELTDPLNPLGGPFMCAFTYKGYWGPANMPRVPDASEESFHRWDNLTQRAGCPSLNGRRYVLQVQTGRGTASLSGGGIDDPDGTVGSNNYSVAACQLCSGAVPTNDAQVAVSAITKMSLYSHAAGSAPNFYLARVPAWAAGQTLTVEFFDIGDVDYGSGTLNLKMLSADGTDASGSPIGEFQDCKSSDPTSRPYLSGQPSPWKPGATDTDWGSLSSTGGDCNVTVTKSSQPKWNGSWVVFHIPIPGDYTCDEADFTKCWVKLQFALSDPGASYLDTTTWFATLSGNPVRLVK